MIRFGYALAALAARRLPVPLAYALARRGAGLFWRFSPRRRRAVLANLARIRPLATPAERRGLARLTFDRFAESLVDAFRLAGNPDGARAAITIEGADLLRAALAGGQGVLLWSAHLGNWELAAAALAREGFDVAAIARAQSSAGVEAFFAERRAHAGVRVVARCPGAREARRVLRGHGLLALLGDRRFGVGGRAVPLFGRPARLPAAPVALAQRTGAALVPGFVVRTGPGRYRIHVEPALAAGGERALERLAATLERYVGAHPEQWFVFEPLWDETLPESA